jgi:putative ABC transport system permease protein
MSRWLEDFVYRITLTPLVFVVGGALALLVAFLTVGYQALRAASANPVEALRYE